MSSIHQILPKSVEKIQEFKKFSNKPSSTFQSVVMLMFREEKSPEDEIKAWQFWHGRQHSVKQRILDAGESVLRFISH